MEVERDVSERTLSSKSPIRDMSQVPNPTSAAIAIADNIPPASNIDVEKQPPSPDAVTAPEHVDDTAGSKQVGWDGDNDALNPLNWKSGKKWRILAVVSVMTIITCVTFRLIYLHESAALPYLTFVQLTLCPVLSVHQCLHPVSRR
jgi:hypothetical protein